jgi:ribonuclease VapC
MSPRVDAGGTNWSEVLQKARQHAAPADIVGRLLASFGLAVLDVTKADAEAAARLWRQGSGLPLADRLCLALGLRMGMPVATADATWADVEGGPEVAIIR